MKKELLDMGYSEEEADIIVEKLNSLPKRYEQLILNLKDKNPTFLEMAIKFTGSLLGHVAGGMKKVSQEEMDRRMDICKGCEFFTDGDRPRCSKCGCHLNIKARWESAHCPIDKW
jgi:hypothetical protein